MHYTVQRGDTIAQVTKHMGSDWQTLKRLNPQAVGRSRNGNWFLREGATLSALPGREGFAEALQQAERDKAVAVTTPAPERGGGLPAAGEVLHTLQAGETVWELAVRKYHVDPEEILALNDIDDPHTLQIGRTLRIPRPERTEAKEVVASWYGEYHHGRPMANGEPFDMHEPTIAHKHIPLGTRVMLENPMTGERAMARVTDRGPYVQGRDVDLSYQLAQRLSLVKQGVGSLIMRVL